MGKIAAYVDWTFFFHAWELRGRFPRILDDPDKGKEARKLFVDAKAMLARLIDEQWLDAKAVVGLFPGNAVGKLNRDQVVDYAERKGGPLADAERWLSPNIACEP